MLQYTPPPSIAPFEEMAQRERTVRRTIEYAIKSCSTVARKPSWPTTNPGIKRVKEPREEPYPFSGRVKY